MLPAARPSRTVPLPLAFERYFEIALYLMVVAGFGTLAATRTLDFPTLWLVVCALLFRGYLLIGRRAPLLPEGWTNFLTVAYMAFYVPDYLLISRGFLAATVHLVLFVMLLRLYSAQRDRDYYFLTVLSFLTVLAASVLTVDSMFLVAFAGFMLMAVTTFILMEMRHASAKAAIRPQDSNDEKAARRMAVSLAGAAPLIVLLILMGAALIFFVLPRMSAGYLNAYAARNELALGFSDRVELGQIGRLQQSRSVVMHVQIDGDQAGGSELLLRGVALSTFDGRVWLNLSEQRIVPRRPDGRFVLWLGEDHPAAAGRPGVGVRSIHYRVMMEPVGSNVFFLALTPQTLQGNYRLVSMDSGAAVYDADGDHPVNSYQASSNIARPSPAELRTASGSYPPEVQQYLQFPSLDPRIPLLATTIRASTANSYDTAAAIENYLRTHFGYTLQLSSTRPSDPLAEFLFVRKQGHCEYFASSMTVMLRSLGIPARVVNGFRMSEFNDITSQYVVRDSDAHSWVEAYFPGYGWVSFDPTPAGSDQTQGLSRIMLYVDAMESFWREWVIGYDIGHQVALGQSTVQSSQRWFMHVRNQAIRRYMRLLEAVRRAHSSWAGFPARWSAGAGLGVVLVLLLANARRLEEAIRNRRLAGHPEKAPGRAAEIWYGRLLNTLARRGWRKPPEQTPTEFVGCIEDDAVRGQVARFTEDYEWARFGGSADHARRLPELYQSIVTTTRR
jgi:hypothetical protein